VSSRLRMSLDVKVLFEEREVATWSLTFVSSPDRELSIRMLRNTSFVGIPMANMHELRSVSLVLTNKRHSIFEYRTFKASCMSNIWVIGPSCSWRDFSAVQTSAHHFLVLIPTYQLLLLLRTLSLPTMFLKLSNIAKPLNMHEVLTSPSPSWYAHLTTSPLQIPWNRHPRQK